jgi:hypothetical protein
MPEARFTFQKFNDEVLADNLIAVLTTAGIDILVEDDKQIFDPSFASNLLTREIRLKLRPEDFEKAQQIVAEYYSKQLDEVDKDYYLFEFTDLELTEIITKPDEWGDFDYQLAQKLLKDRGKEINPEILTLLRKQRNEDLAKSESSNSYIIYLGYISAILGGLVGILIGWHLAYSKKTLPDGRRLYRYKDSERNHGTRMLLLAAIILLMLLLARLFFLSQ